MRSVFSEVAPRAKVTPLVIGNPILPYSFYSDDEFSLDKYNSQNSSRLTDDELLDSPEKITMNFTVKPKKVCRLSLFIINKKCKL